jgi:hypothetical protein
MSMIMSMKREASGRRFVQIEVEEPIPSGPVGTRSTASVSRSAPVPGRSKMRLAVGLEVHGPQNLGASLRSSMGALLLGVALLTLLPSARAQESSAPGKELEHLKQMVGTWDAESESGKGTMTYTMGLGGLWLIGDFDGEFGGIKFEGKFLDTYDSETKKYRSVHVSSFTTGVRIMEGTLNNKVMTMTGEGPGHDGKPGKFKSITEFKDADTVNFTLFMADKDGKEQPVVKITYKRKK